MQSLYIYVQIYSCIATLERDADTYISLDSCNPPISTSYVYLRIYLLIFIYILYIYIYTPTYEPQDLASKVCDVDIYISLDSCNPYVSTSYISTHTSI